MQAVAVLRQPCVLPKGIAHPLVASPIGQRIEELGAPADIHMDIRAASPEMKMPIFHIKAALVLGLENESVGTAPLVTAVQTVEFSMQFIASHCISFAQDVPPAGAMRRGERSRN